MTQRAIQYWVIPPEETDQTPLATHMKHFNPLTPFITISKISLSTMATNTSSILSKYILYQLRFASVHIIEKDDEGYFAYCPELKGCMTQGDSFEAVMENLKEAIELYLETLTQEESESELTEFSE